MKKLLIIVLTSFMLIACKKDDNNDNNNCNFLIDVGVNVNVSLNLHPYSQLISVGNFVYIPNYGNAGIIVINAGSGFLAWDAADPNHTQSSCSIVGSDELIDNIGSGFEGTCGCSDKNKYSFVTGQPIGNTESQCGLRNYRVEANGDSLLIYN